MKAAMMALLIGLLLPTALAAKEDVNPADLVIKASEARQKAEALCKDGEFDEAIEQYEEALDTYNDAAKAYRAAGDKNSEKRVKDTIKSVKDDRDECKKKRREAEKAKKEKQKKDDGNKDGTGDGR